MKYPWPFLLNGRYLKDVDVESNVKTVTLPSGVVIEDIVVGDTTKRLAKKGRMVCVNIFI